MGNLLEESLGETLDSEWEALGERKLNNAAIVESANQEPKLWCCFDFYSNDFQLEAIFSKESEARAWRNATPSIFSGEACLSWVFPFTRHYILDFFKDQMYGQLAKLESITIKVDNNNRIIFNEELKNKYKKVLYDECGIQPIAAVFNNESKSSDLES